MGQLCYFWYQSDWEGRGLIPSMYHVLKYVCEKKLNFGMQTIIQNIAESIYLHLLIALICIFMCTIASHSNTLHNYCAVLSRSSRWWHWTTVWGSLEGSRNTPSTLLGFKVKYVFTHSYTCTHTHTHTHTDDKLIHLDPHFCQTATEVRKGEDLHNFETKVSPKF